VAILAEASKERDQTDPGDGGLLGEEAVDGTNSQTALLKRSGVLTQMV